MSYFEDFEEDRIGSLEWEEEYFNYISKINRPKYVFQTLNNTWKTREGKVVELKDMSKNHIINSLNMILKICNREGWKAEKFIIYNNLRKELKKRK